MSGNLIIEHFSFSSNGENIDFPHHNFGNRRTLNFKLWWPVTLTVPKPNIRKIISFVFASLLSGLLMSLFHPFCLYTIFTLRCLNYLELVDATNSSRVAVLSISDAKCVMASVEVDYMGRGGPILSWHMHSPWLSCSEWPSRCCIGDRIFWALLKSRAFLA